MLKLKRGSEEDYTVPKKLISIPTPWRVIGNSELGGGGGVVFKVKIFPGGRGCKTKILPRGEYGYFLALHIWGQGGVGKGVNEKTHENPTKESAGQLVFQYFKTYLFKSKVQ